MSKLTKMMKDQIVRDVLLHKVEPQREELKKKKQTLALIAYKDVLGARKKWVLSAPEHGLPTRSAFYLVFGTTHSERVYVKLDHDLAVPYDMYYTSELDITKNPSLVEKVKMLYREDSSIDKYKEELTTELRGILAGCTTWKQLIKVLPEITEYTKVEDNPFYAPVLQTDKIKQLLKV